MNTTIAAAPHAALDSHDRPSIPWALVTLSLTTLLASLGTSIANVALPTLATAFSAPFQRVQWVVLAYLLAMTTLLVSVGRLGDHLGRKRLLLAGIALFIVASAICAGAPTLPILIAGRAVQGLGAAVMTALTLAFVAGAAPKERTGRAMGMLGTMSAVGTALGPTVGGILISAFGWRSIFALNVPLGALVMIATSRSLPAGTAEARRQGVRFDPVGTVLLVATLAAYALSMTLGRGHFGRTNSVLLAASLTFAALFVAAERRVQAPLVRLSIFRTRILSSGFAMSAMVTTVVMATLVVGPFYLSRALGAGAAIVGVVMSCGPLVAALTGVPAGRAVDRFGSAAVARGGLVAMVGGSSLLAILPARAGIAGYAASLAVITCGYSLFQVANNTSVMGAVAEDQRGVVSGMLNLSRNLGLITGASVMGAVFAARSGAANVAGASPQAVVDGMHAAFALSAVLVALAIAISFSGRRNRGEVAGAAR